MKDGDLIVDDFFKELREFDKKSNEGIDTEETNQKHPI